jgi:hypothetical protein
MKVASPIIFEELSTSPSNPAVGEVKLFSKLGKLKKLDSAGRETNVDESPWNGVVVVNDITTDLPTAVSGVITLASNTTYWFNEGIFTFTDTLQLSNGTNIFGFSNINTVLVYSGSLTFISGSNTNAFIKDIRIQAPSGNCFQVTNGINNILNLENVDFTGCQSAGLINGGGFSARFVSLRSVVSNGFTFNGSLASITIDNCSFGALSGGISSYAIKVNTGATGSSFNCFNSNIVSNTGHYGIWISGTYTLTNGAIIFGNTFSGTGATNLRLSGVNGNTASWNIR